MLRAVGTSISIEMRDRLTGSKLQANVFALRSFKPPLSADRHLLDSSHSA